MRPYSLVAGTRSIRKKVPAAGLMASVATWISEISTARSFPILNLISSGFLNVLVPSGGGQWIVQGPIIVEASINNGVPIAKSVMAMSYGDQLTNMMQPFWALPLLGITGLKAKEILPYSLFLMLLGFVVFSFMLMFF